MKNLTRLSLIALFVLNLNAEQDQGGLSEEQMNEYISAIEKDIEKLKNEMLEAIKNNKIVDIG